MSRQNAETMCKNGAVGPECLQSPRKPLDPSETELGGSAEQALRFRPSLKPSLARLPTLKTAAARNTGNKRTAVPVSTTYA